MNGNDSRYDKSKPREATDQYSPGQYELKGSKEVAAQANPTLPTHAWALSTSRVMKPHQRDGDEAPQVARDRAEYDTRRGRPAVRAGPETTSELTANRGVEVERDRLLSMADTTCWHCSRADDETRERSGP